MAMKEIERQVLDDFRRILGLEPDAPVPNALEEKYRTYRHRKDVCAAGNVTPSELILLSMMIEDVKLPENEEPPVDKRRPAAEKAAMKPGDKVTTKWKGEAVPGCLYEDPGGDKLLVKIAGDEMKYREVLRSDTELCE